MDVIERIKQQVDENQVLLYMKGTPDFPQCGFSARTSQILNACGVKYGHVNVLAEPDIRASLPKYSNWPTCPTLCVKGELIGGCDIAIEMFESGELKKLCEEKGIAHS